MTLMKGERFDAYNKTEFVVGTMIYSFYVPIYHKTISTPFVAWGLLHLQENFIGQKGL